MTKNEFLEELRQGLYGFSYTDIQKSVEFYEEMIDDRVEDGMTEEEAVADIGNVRDVVSQILIEMPLPKLVKAKVNKSKTARQTKNAKSGMGPWSIVLIILGSPIWASLLIAAIAVVFSLYVAGWSILITLYAADVSVFVCGVVGMIASAPVAFLQTGAAGAVIFGGGMACIGISILLIFAINLLVKGYCLLTRLLWRGLKKLFI